MSAVIANRFVTDCALSEKERGGQDMSMSTFDAEELVEACAAGYVSRTHPDVQTAVKVIGEKKANDILSAKTSDYDALQRCVAGCYGAGSRR